MDHLSSKRELILLQAANEVRGLCLDMVHEAKSGHLGLPLGAAEIGSVLFGQFLEVFPKHPRVCFRDRFVLSAGHGSAWLYAWLHLLGFDLSLDDLKNFRQWGSKTPGHPEHGISPGVEATTGPLGQGIANAVGMAIAQKRRAAEFIKARCLSRCRTVVLCGEGCLQEGVAQEAIDLAGHWGLNNLILLYDENGITLDALAQKTQSINIQKRFEASGWEVQVIDGHRVVEIHRALTKARQAQNCPQLIIAKTVIGKGVLEIEGTTQAHGEKGARFLSAAKQRLGITGDFFVSPQVRDFFKQRREELEQKFLNYEGELKHLKVSFALDSSLEIQEKLLTPEVSLIEAIPPFAGEKLATRTAAGQILNWIAPKFLRLLTASADLFSSTKNEIKNGGDFCRENALGRNFSFGIREHAQGAILNGIAYGREDRVIGATFLVFSDYMKPAIRLAALANLPVVYWFTHDSIGVGEDGPTHQPIEQLSALRSIPRLEVFRPADAEECVGAMDVIFRKTQGPSALILSRQDLELLESIEPQKRRKGVSFGAYVARQEEGDLKGIILASGSELALALRVANQLGKHIRVISMPCQERFEAQDLDYKKAILPLDCFRRLAIEAGDPMSWGHYIGLQGKVIGLSDFGHSAPAKDLYAHLKFDEEAIFLQAEQYFRDR